MFVADKDNENTIKYHTYLYQFFQKHLYMLVLNKIGKVLELYLINFVPIYRSSTNSSPNGHRTRNKLVAKEDMQKYHLTPLHQKHFFN